MMGRAGWRAWLSTALKPKDQRVLERRAIPDALWTDAIRSHSFIAARPPHEHDQLRVMVSHFLDRKEFHAVPPLVLTDEMALSVALQACLPVLHLGLEQYDGFVGIVMQGGAVKAPREEIDDIGVVHTYELELSGEAMDGGPLMLSWEDVQRGQQTLAAAGSNEPAYNVVLHEFAHVLDMRDGVADGVPLLPNEAAREHWARVIQVEFDFFNERVVCGHDTVVDPYGTESTSEFFAVASEAFFVAPRALQEEQPALYRLLSDYYRQDPAAH